MSRNQTILFIIFICLALFLAICGIALIYYRKWLAKQNEDQILLSERKTNVRWIHAMYRMLMDFPITKHYVARLRRRYEMIEPGDKKRIEEDTIKTLAISMGLSLGVLTLTLALGLSMYACIAAGAMIYVINTYVVFKSVNSKELLLLHQTKNFITEVRHYYFTTGSVTSALYEALVEAPSLIQMHMEKIYYILESDDIEEEMNIYNEHTPNRFLKLFLSICVTIVSFDDREVEGESLFVTNLSYLKDAIENEVRNRVMMKHRLQSFAIISAVPMFLLKPLQNWAITNLPEVEHYYTGAYGTICFTLICVASLVIYNMILNMHTLEYQESGDHAYLDNLLNISWIKAVVNAMKYRNYGKVLKLDELMHRIGESLTVEQLYLKRLIMTLVVIVIGFLMSFSIHYNNKQYIVNSKSNIDNLLTGYTGTTPLDDIKSLIVEITNAYKDDNDVDYSGIMKAVESQNLNLNENYVLIISKEIIKRINKYRNEYFMWYELIIILLSGLIGYKIPIWEINYNKQKLERNMEDEVIQFQSVIVLLMYIERISCLDILKWMENFASIFKKSIAECIDDFPNGEQEALLRLKEKETYPGFQKLVDNMLDTDRIGVRRAFDEIQADIINLGEKRRQDNIIYIDTMANRASLLSSIPASATILLYLCGPILIEAFAKFSEYTDSITSMM